MQEIASLYAVGPVSSSLGGEQKSDVNKQYLGSKLAEYIRVINECYPEEIVRYYSPGYSTTLLSKIDGYNVASEKVAPVAREAPPADVQAPAANAQETSAPAATA